MKTTYLKDFEEMAKKGIAYVPVGTIEWHGNHLPIETDFMVAQKICEKLSEKNPGYILPPIYLGAYGTKVINSEEMRGMDKRLGKKLSGNLYFLDKDTFVKLLLDLTDNLKKQGFKRIVIVTGHGGSNQLGVLEEINKDKNVLVINPYENLDVHHADEGETSLLWACYPEEEHNSRSVEIPTDDDYFVFHGCDPREKASLEIGQKYLSEIIEILCKKLLN